MKKILIVFAVFAFATTARAGGIEAGNGIGSLMIGAGQVGGNDGDLYETGLLTSVNYTHYHSPSLGYGGEISLHRPDTKSKDVAGSVSRQSLNGRFLSVLAMGRFNLTPSGNHTPYVSLGMGVAQHRVKETLTPIAGGPASETLTDFWRGTYVLALGWDCLKHEKWIAGVETRFQYLDKLMMNYGVGLRLGWRY